MVPIALIGSTVYMALQLVRTNLSHEKYLDEAHATVKDLETKLAELQNQKGQSESGSEDAQASSSKKWWLF